MSSTNKDPKTQMKMEAMEKARGFVELMRNAKTDPTVKIDGEALEIWKEFDEWGVLDRYPIEDSDNNWIYVTMLSMTQLRHLLWESEDPAKKAKLTKWEVVHGRSVGKRR